MPYPWDDDDIITTDPGGYLTPDWHGVAGGAGGYSSPVFAMSPESGGVAESAFDPNAYKRFQVASAIGAIGNALSAWGNNDHRAAQLAISSGINALNPLHQAQALYYGDRAKAAGRAASLAGEKLELEREEASRKRAAEARKDAAIEWLGKNPTAPREEALPYLMALDPSVAAQAFKPVEWSPIADGAYLVNKQTGETRSLPEVQADILRQRQASRAAAPQMSVKFDQGPQFGSIPPGFMLRKVGEGSYQMEPVPGSPPEKADVARKRASQQVADIVTTDIDRALEKIAGATLPVTGALGAVTRRVPGTPAFNIDELMESVRANVSFDKLQALRDASPTGGALGNVTEYEVRRLESALGSLSVAQSEAQLIENLKRVKQIYQEIIHGPAAASGKPSGGATWKWNAETGKLEPAR